MHLVMGGSLASKRLKMGASTEGMDLLRAAIRKNVESLFGVGFPLGPAGVQWLESLKA